MKLKWRRAGKKNIWKGRGKTRDKKRERKKSSSKIDGRLSKSYWPVSDEQQNNTSKKKRRQKRKRTEKTKTTTVTLYCAVKQFKNFNTIFGGLLKKLLFIWSFKWIVQLTNYYNHFFITVNADALSFCFFVSFICSLWSLLQYETVTAIFLAVNSNSSSSAFKRSCRRLTTFSYHLLQLNCSS